MRNDHELGPVARRLSATQRVLCVEDEPDIAAFLRAYFGAAGYDLVHIDPASAADVALAMAEHRPDAVLLDLRLRGFSGVDAYRLIRADDRWAFVPVIMVSSHAERDPAFTQPTGIDAFVSKPFNTDLLADLVRHRMDVAAALAERGRHQDLELMTQAYVEARLTDEVAVADISGPLAFALVRLVSMDAVTAEVGASGRDHVLRRIIRAGGDALPPDAVLGLMETDEVAVVLPDRDVDGAEQVLRPVLETQGGVSTFPGGASVPVDLACGVASYPTHAADVDELFMAADAALTDAVESGSLIRQAL
jgi:DNA-binding response OmpR family regulator